MSNNCPSVLASYIACEQAVKWGLEHERRSREGIGKGGRGGTVPYPLAASPLYPTKQPARRLPPARTLVTSRVPAPEGVCDKPKERLRKRLRYRSGQHINQVSNSEMTSSFYVAGHTLSVDVPRTL